MFTSLHLLLTYNRQTFLKLGAAEILYINYLYNDIIALWFKCLTRHRKQFKDSYYICYILGAFVWNGNNIQVCLWKKAWMIKTKPYLLFHDHHHKLCLPYHGEFQYCLQICPQIGFDLFYHLHYKDGVTKVVIPRNIKNTHSRAWYKTVVAFNIK